MNFFIFPLQSEVAPGAGISTASVKIQLNLDSTDPLGESGSIGCQTQGAGVAGGGSGGTMLGRVRLREVADRWEAMRKRHDQWTCFLCCHVRTGTIVIGIWHMLLHLVLLSLIAMMVVHPEILRQPGSPLGGLATSGEHLDIKQDVQATNCGAEMPCILAKQGDESTDTDTKVNGEPLSLSRFISHPLNSDEVNITVFLTLCMFLVTLLLVYGAFRHQPSHLMPFFFLQVFDFCISSMTMIGYLSYLPNIRQLILESPPFPFQQQLLAMNTKCLTFFAMLIFISTLMAKAYCISIVWRCYKYLMLKAQAGRLVLRYLGGMSGNVDQESQTLVVGQDLPDYDTAMADPQYRKKLSGMFPEPPPSYDVAMAALCRHLEVTGDQREIPAATTHSLSPLCEGAAASSLSVASQTQVSNRPASSVEAGSTPITTTTSNA